MKFNVEDLVEQGLVKKRPIPQENLKDFLFLNILRKSFITIYGTKINDFLIAVEW